MGFINTSSEDRRGYDITNATAPVSELEFLSASFTQNIEDSLGGTLGRFARRKVEDLTGMNDYPEQSTLQPEELNKLYPDIGLKFTKPMPQPVAAELYAAQMEDMERRRIIEQGKTQNSLNKIIDPAMGIGIGILDPSNIALGAGVEYGIGRVLGKTAMSAISKSPLKKYAYQAFAGVSGNLLGYYAVEKPLVQKEQKYTDDMQSSLMGIAAGAGFPLAINAISKSYRGIKTLFKGKNAEANAEKVMAVIDSQVAEGKKIDLDDTITMLSKENLPEIINEHTNLTKLKNTLDNIEQLKTNDKKADYFLEGRSEKYIDIVNKAEMQDIELNPNERGVLTVLNTRNIESTDITPFTVEEMGKIDAEAKFITEFNTKHAELDTIEYINELKKAEREGLIKIPAKIVDTAQLETLYRTPEDISQLNSRIEEVSTVIEKAKEEPNITAIRENANTPESNVNFRAGVSKGVTEFKGPEPELFKPSKMFKDKKDETLSNLDMMKQNDIIDQSEYDSISKDLNKPELVDEIHRQLTNCVIGA